MNKTRNILFSFVVLGLCTILFALLMLVSCSGNGVTQPKRLQFTPAEQQLVQDCNDFSFNLLAQTASDEQQENIILSPLSASMLLGMLMNGADGETLRQIQQVVGFDDNTPLSDINAYYRQLIDGATRLLSREGILALISPTDAESAIIEAAAFASLPIRRCTRVVPVEGAEAKRTLWLLSLREMAYVENTLTIAHEDGTFTQEYINLTGAFYLKMPD